MSGIASEVLIIMGLLLLNGIFAMSELAIVTARKVRLEQRAEDGDKGAQAALALAQDPTQFLSTVQVGITLIGVLAGAFGGATISEELAVPFAAVPAVAPYADALALGIVVTGITYLSLLIGELIPKRVALSHPERVAAIVARPMRLLARVASPLVVLLTGPTNLVMRLFGVRVSSDPSLTQLEIRALIEQGAESGVVDVAEHEIVESVFRLGDRQVADVMIPRTRMEWIDESEGLDHVRASVAAQARAWYLVCRGEVDDVLGVMYAEDLLAQCLRGEALALPALLVQPLYVPATLPALDLLDQFKASHQSIAIALDEHGGVQGIVTLDELVTAVVGEIPEEGETASPDFTRRNERSWVARGDAILEDFESALDLDEIRDSERRGVRTLGGFVMALLGRVPVVGDTVAWRDLRIEVTHMEGRRVERLAITRLPPHSPAQPPRE